MPISKNSTQPVGRNSNQPSQTFKRTLNKKKVAPKQTNNRPSLYKNNAKKRGGRQKNYYEDSDDSDDNENSHSIDIKNNYSYSRPKKRNKNSEEKKESRNFPFKPADNSKFQNKKSINYNHRTKELPKNRESNDMHSNGFRAPNRAKPVQRSKPKPRKKPKPKRQAPAKRYEPSPKFDDEEIEYNFSGPHANLEPCRVCGRTFAEDRIKKHQAACKISARKPRKIKRFHKVLTRKEKMKIKKNKPVGKWKQQHTEFVKHMQYMRKLKKIEDQGGDIRDIAPPPPSAPNPDFVACKFCDRKFRPEAHGRHEGICQRVFGGKKKQARKAPAQKRRKRY